MPGILMVQHMPEMFTAPFAKRLDGLCQLRVKEAEHGEKVQPGTVSSGAWAFTPVGAPGWWAAMLRAGPVRAVVNRHRPAVDVLFTRREPGQEPMGWGFILTGMGRTAPRGAGDAQAGAWTIGRIRIPVWFGMPREAAAMGALECGTIEGYPGRWLARLRGSSVGARGRELLRISVPAQAGSFKLR